MGFLIHLLVTAVLLLIVAKMVSGFEVENFGSALLAALVLGLVNALVRPLAVFLSLPLTILTLGLFLFVINALMLMIVGAVVPGMKIKGFGTAFVAALLLAILNLVIAALFGGLTG